jgi:glutathione S-transferase
MRIKRWEALADGIVDSAVVVRTERIRPDEKQEPDIITRHNDSISRALSFAADLLGQNRWCEGRTITLADFSLASALIYLDLRQPERNWRKIHPNLTIWFSSIGEIASIKQSMAT